MEMEGVLSMANGGTGLIQQCSELARIADALTAFTVVFIVYVIIECIDTFRWWEKHP